MFGYVMVELRMCCGEVEDCACAGFGGHFS